MSHALLHWVIIGMLIQDLLETGYRLWKTGFELVTGSIGHPCSTIQDQTVFLNIIILPCWTRSTTHGCYSSFPVVSVFDETILFFYYLVGPTIIISLWIE